MKIIIKNLVLYSIITLFGVILVSCQTQDRQMRQAITKQLDLYPESRLQDIYKSFFQDEFGPGHLVDNVSFAREYFDLELEEMISRGNREVEPCGLGKNFYRIPMDLVKDGIIPEEDYFKSFMESSKNFKAPDIKSWEIKWEEILIEIEAMDLQIPNLERDKKAIAKYLKQGESVVHHSDAYNDTYDPHYRIFSKEQWEMLKGSFIDR